MRWLQLNCVLIAGFAILSATNAEGPRNKRDLSLIKKIIKLIVYGREDRTTPAPIFINNEENVRILSIPGFDNILAQAIPTAPKAVAIPEKNEQVPFTVADRQKASIVASYLGTQSEAETIKALQGVKVLLSSGILTAKKDVQEVVPIRSVAPHLQLVTVDDNAGERSHILFDSSTICDEMQVNERPVLVQRQPLLPIFQRPIPFPTVVKPAYPVRVPVSALPAKYSYKQIHGDGKVTTYTSNDNHNVVVTETGRPVPLPPFVTYRIQEVMKLGARRVLQGMGTIPVFEGYIRKPVVQHFDSPKVNMYSPTNYFYKQMNKDGTTTSYSSDLKGDLIVSQTGKVPTIPEFITDRIEKVAATAVTGKQPNIDVLSGQNVAHIHLMTNDARRGVQVKVDSKEQQKMNVVSKGTYSYQTVYNDGTVTNHLNEALTLAIHKPVAKVNVKPISSAFTQNRLESIPKTNGGSFSYKILHSDGSVTNYGDLGVLGINGENKIAPLNKETPYFQASTPLLNEEGSDSSFKYKIVHNDGSVSSYSSTGVIEEMGSNSPISGYSHEDNKLLNSKQDAATVIESNINRAKGHIIQHDMDKSSQSENPPQGLFSYKAIDNDVSMKIYSENGVSEINGQQKENMSDKQEATKQKAKQDVTVNKQVSPLTNTSPVPGSFSYKMVHNDGSVTTYSQNGVKKGQTDLKVRDENQQSLTDHNQVKGDKITSSGSFTYKTIHSDGSETNYPGDSKEFIKVSNVVPATQNMNFDDTKLHSDSSVTNFGVFGLYKVINDENKIMPLAKETPPFQASTPLLNEEGSDSSFKYKIVHNDGSVSSYSSTGVIEEMGSNSPLSGYSHEDNKLLNRKQDAATVIESNINRATGHIIQQDMVKSSQSENPPQGLFSYKAIHNDGSMTIYSENGVSEINGQHKENMSAKQDVKVNEQVSPLTNTSPVPGSFSYKMVHNDGSVTTYSQEGQTDLKVKVENQQSLSDHNQVKGDNITSSGTFTYKTIHSDGSETSYSGDSKEFIKVASAVPAKQNMNFEDRKLHTNLPNMEMRPDDSKSNSGDTGTTDVIPPPPELQKNSSRMLTEGSESALIAESNKMLLTRPIVSSYSYKQINHNQPDQFAVAVNVGEVASKESWKISSQASAISQANEAAQFDTELKDYVYIPPATLNEPVPIRPFVPKEEIHVGENPPSAVVLTPVENVTCVEKLSEHPIVVLDEPMQYLYEHRKVDGSAMIVESDQKVVSVTITPKRDEKRGDIP